jgi:hypothetical protein
LQPRRLDAIIIGQQKFHITAQVSLWQSRGDRRSRLSAAAAAAALLNGHRTNKANNLPRTSRTAAGRSAVAQGWRFSRPAASPPI